MKNDLGDTGDTADLLEEDTKFLSDMEMNCTEKTKLFEENVKYRTQMATKPLQTPCTDGTIGGWCGQKNVPAAASVFASRSCFVLHCEIPFCIVCMCEFFCVACGFNEGVFSDTVGTGCDALCVLHCKNTCVHRIAV